MRSERARSTIASRIVFALAVGLALYSLAQPGAFCQDWDKTLKDANYKLSINDKEGAIKEFEKQVKKHPASGACHTGLGKTFKRMGKFSEAKAEFLKATEVEPTYADGFYELGSSLEADKEWAGAADAFQKFCELNPDGAKRQAVPDRVMHCRNQIK